MSTSAEPNHTFRYSLLLNPPSFGWIFVVSHLSWPTRHFFQNSTPVQCVNVMTNNLLTRTRVVLLLWGGAVVVFPTSCFLVKTRLGPPTTAPFCISYASFSGAYSSDRFLSWSIPRRRYCKDTPRSDTASSHVDTKPWVKSSPFFLCIQEGADIQIVVILQPTVKCSHSLLPEHLLAVLILLQQQDKRVFQFWEPTTIQRQAIIMQSVSTVKPLIWQPWFCLAASIHFHPPLITRAWPQIITNVQKLEICGWNGVDKNMILPCFFATVTCFSAPMCVMKYFLIIFRSYLLEL